MMVRYAAMLGLLIVAGCGGDEADDTTLLDGNGGNEAVAGLSGGGIPTGTESASGGSVVGTDAEAGSGLPGTGQTDSGVEVDPGLESGGGGESSTGEGAPTQDEEEALLPTKAEKVPGLKADPVSKAEAPTKADREGGRWKQRLRWSDCCRLCRRRL